MGVRLPDSRSHNLRWFARQRSHSNPILSRRSEQIDVIGKLTQLLKRRYNSTGVWRDIIWRGDPRFYRVVPEELSSLPIGQANPLDS
jgi:hypothetical protein